LHFGRGSSAEIISESEISTHAPSFGVLGYLAVGAEREIVDGKMRRRDGVDVTISKEDAEDADDVEL
jgi:hypothetical protein